MQDPELTFVYAASLDQASRVAATVRTTELAYGVQSAGQEADSAIILDVAFPESGGHVSVGVMGGEVDRLVLHQVLPAYVLVSVEHPMTDQDGQCTVFCPASGESRTGRNVCIECRGPRGTVKICC